jgi:hypothetical protein
VVNLSEPGSAAEPEAPALVSEEARKKRSSRASGKSGSTSEAAPPRTRQRAPRGTPKDVLQPKRKPPPKSVPKPPADAPTTKPNGHGTGVEID